MLIVYSKSIDFKEKLVRKPYEEVRNVKYGHEILLN